MGNAKKNAMAWGVATLLWAWWLPGALAQTTMIYVDAAADGENDGTSWFNACNTLQDALAAAQYAPKPVEIWVAEGTYTPDQGESQTPGDRYAAFQLINDVAAYGGFPPGGEDWDSRDPCQYKTILSGDLAGNDVAVTDPCDLLTEPTRAENSYHVFCHPSGLNLQDEAILNGFTITAGNANGGEALGYGGGMYNLESSPTVSFCIFRKNSAQLNGGGMHNQTCSPDVSACSFVANAAYEYGGGMSNVESSTTVSGCTFAGNSVRSDGGGMYNLRSTPTVSDCTFRGNTSWDRGGGMQNLISSPTVLRTVFDGNVARDYGGGLANFYSNHSTVIDCVFKGNSAGTGGGGMHNNESSPTVTQCIFQGNFAEVGGGVDIWNNSKPMVSSCIFNGNSALAGGGLRAIKNSAPTVSHCTFYGNTAAEAGGGMDVWNNSNPVVNHCIFWNNAAVEGPQLAVAYESHVSLAYANIQGGEEGIHINSESCTLNWGAGNVDEQPLLTPDGHLRPASPCINAGDVGFVPDPSAYDIDGEDRIMEASVDIGADEFCDGDEDGIPDWWEQQYFGDPQVARPDDDPDGDSLTNLDEYELYSSNPKAGPIIVDDDAPNDPGPGDPTLSDPFRDGTVDHPFDAIQEALDAAEDGDTVLVAPGTYTGMGNRNLNSAGKAVVLRSMFGPEETSIDCQQADRAFDFRTHETARTAVVGFTISNGQADWGGAIYCESSHPQFRDCTLMANTASQNGGGMWAYLSLPSLEDCIFSSNSPNGLVMEDGGMQVEGIVEFINNDLRGKRLMFTGEGAWEMEPGVTFNLNDVVIRCSLLGEGTVKVDLGSELTIECDAVVDLGHPTNPQLNGTVQCDGLLCLRDQAQFHNARVTVSRASFEDDTLISNSVITAEAGAPYGQFFIEGSAEITHNVIRADGDRYADMDREAFMGVMADNEMYVTITEGKGQTRGGLFELRGQDLNEGACGPNQFVCQLAPGTIQACTLETWTVEELVIEAGAKVNLTNRFDFQAPFGSSGANEVLYVRNLVLGPGAILNTAFNQLYYETATIDPCAEFANEPLLGFSLNNIAFDFEVDFLNRVRHNNFQHLTNSSYNRTHVERIVDPCVPDPCGVMRLRNLRDDNPDSVTQGQIITARAKGLFAKASETEIRIWFEYLFETADPEVELVMYLTDAPELLAHSDPQRPTHYREVARLSPPPSDDPGSYGSARFGVFSRLVATGNLGFVRGTRIELELLGPENASILINNWDPYVECTSTCGDVDGHEDVTVKDFLTVVGEYGEAAGLTPGGNSRACLDCKFSEDGYLDASDVICWDWWLALSSPSSLCGVLALNPPGPRATTSGWFGIGGSLAGGGAVPAGAVILAGKAYNPNAADISAAYLEDRLYALNDVGLLTATVVTLSPSRANHRLITDQLGVVHQINLRQGLIRLPDRKNRVPADLLSTPAEPRYGQAATVAVGLHGDENQGWWGRPLLDAAFGPAGELYITPVVVVPTGRESYLAAAQLVLEPNEVSLYELVRLYDDSDYALNTNSNLNAFREIELGNAGGLYVLNSHEANDSDILWVYDAATGVKLDRCKLSAPAGLGVTAPIALHVSGHDGRVYVSSAQQSPTATSTTIYGLDGAPLGIQRRLTVHGMGHVTDIAEDPSTGTLWVAGFTMTNIPDQLDNWEIDNPPFYQPYLAWVGPGMTQTTATPLAQINPDQNAFDLALPLSLAWVRGNSCGGADVDGDHRVDLRDLGVMTNHWLAMDCLPPGWCGRADTDQGGGVNLADIHCLAERWLERNCVAW